MQAHKRNETHLFESTNLSCTVSKQDTSIETFMFLAFEGLEIDDGFAQGPIIGDIEGNSGGKGVYHLSCCPGVSGERNL